MPKEKIVDLHNHTSLCNHAKGTMEAYVQQAIEQQIAIFGFSDHAPMDFDPHYRMRFSDMGSYEKEVRDLSRQYADVIDIRLGYEVDWLPGHLDPRVLEADVDYLIGSVHFIDKWGFDNPAFIGRYEGADIDQIWRDYFDLIEAMAKSGYFDIVGHLDLIKLFKFLPKTDIRLIAQKAMDAIKQADMVIEINAAGYRKPIGEPYPSETLLQMAYERDIPITFGSDAHQPDHIGAYQKETLALAQRIGYRQAAHFKKRARAFVPISP